MSTVEINRETALQFLDTEKMTELVECAEIFKSQEFSIFPKGLLFSNFYFLEEFHTKRLIKHNGSTFYTVFTSILRPDFNPDINDNLTFYIEKTGTLPGPIDMLVLGFFYEVFLLSFSGVFEYKNGDELMESHFLVNLKIEDILDRLGMPKMSKYRNIVIASLKKLSKINIHINMNINGENMTYTGTILKDSTLNGKEFSCFLGEWFVVLTTIQPVPVVFEFLSMVLRKAGKDLLAFQMACLRFSADDYFDGYGE